MASPASSVRSLPVSAVDERFLVIDVREPAELVELGTLPGAMNVPLGTLVHLGLPDGLYQGRPLLLVCRSGARSGQGASALAARGVEASSLEGGVLAWQAAGRPLERRRPEGVKDRWLLWARGQFMPLAACLTLGLAPYLPEPHVVGKLRWVAGGAVGMAQVDWFDLVLHGAPWLWLMLSAGVGAWRHFGPER